MEYRNQPTHVLEDEYKRLAYTNISGVSQEIKETINYQIDKIWAILYERQELRESIRSFN